LDDASFPSNLAPLVQAIINGTAQGCCDGSYMRELSTNLGAAAWKVEDPASGQAIHGTVQTSGNDFEVNAYRSELQGIHAKLLAISAVCSFYSIAEGAITLGCDNKGGVTRSNGDWLKVNQNTRHADLIRAIRRLKDSLPIRVTFVHIGGHQDDTMAFQELPRLAQLNVEMDHNAKARLRSLIATSSPPLRDAKLRYEGWHCTIDGAKISSDPSRFVYKAVCAPQLRAHLHDRKLLPSSAFNDVDWAAIELATDSFPPLYRLWMSKHVSGFFGLGKMMKHWGFWDHQKCPCCQYIKEDKTHLLTCPAVSCSETWAASVQGLVEWLQEMDTFPAIKECIVLALSTRDVTQSFQAVSPISVRSAATAQDRIGWINFTEGKISKKWRALQAIHYQAIRSQRSSDQWAAGLVTTLLSLVHSQWKHRCHILHERDAQGLRSQEARDLDTAISFQFQSGIDGLHPRDQHLLSRGKDRVLLMTGSGKLSWLSSIRLAREEFTDHIARETESMRNFMTRYLNPS
jgi:hypothetical protein